MALVCNEGLRGGRLYRLKNPATKSQQGAICYKMSGDKYIIDDQHATHFITCRVIRWIDIFTRVEYKNLIVDSLNYCTLHKGLHLNAWVIMSNHLHLVASVKAPSRLSDFLRDFKKFTSKAITKQITEGHESRKDWLLDMFSFEARRSQRAEKYKMWDDSNHAIDLTHLSVSQKINYIHENPVRAGYVYEPHHYPYSSASDYVGKPGLIKNIELV